MTMSDRWQLPEGIEELLPEQAAQVEALRRHILDLFAGWGYQLVIPPLLEYTESLLIGLGRDIDLQSFKVIDQLSGRMLAIRADITPQTARIDAHSLNSSGVQRLCYAGSVLHTMPKSLKASRAPIQVGAELYGAALVDADIEVVCLMLETLTHLGVEEITLDLGHVGIYRELLKHAALSAAQEEELFDLLQRKNLSDLRGWLSAHAGNEKFSAIILRLAQLNGATEVLAQARNDMASAGPVVLAAIEQLQQVTQCVQTRYPQVNLYFDLSELRGYHYHTGLVFAAYSPGSGRAIANGGRYDEIGAVFGRARPATGFNTDLKSLLALANCPALGPLATSAIHAPNSTDLDLWARVRELRASGEGVVADVAATGDYQSYARMLRQDADGKWQVVNSND
ncbi:MAG: ATP phosphoribosyltransferase regulatory subunit [Pseudomonadales bacterium]